MADKGFRYLAKKMKGAPFRGGELGDALEELARHRELKNYISRRITDEGGQVLSIKEMGLLLTNPFRGYSKLGAVFIQAECRYSNDEGTWYVCIYDETEHRWLWKSQGGIPQLPKQRENGDLAGLILHVPYWTANIAVLIIAAGVIWYIWPWLQP